MKLITLDELYQQYKKYSDFFDENYNAIQEITCGTLPKTTFGAFVDYTKRMQGYYIYE